MDAWPLFRSAPAPRSWRAPPPIGQGLAVIAILVAVALASLVGIGGYMLSLRVAAAKQEVGRLSALAVDRRAEVAALARTYEIRSRFGELDRWRAPLALEPMRVGQLAGGAGDIAQVAESRRTALDASVAASRPVDAGGRPAYPQAARARLDDLIDAVAAQ